MVMYALIFLCGCFLSPGVSRHAGRGREVLPRFKVDDVHSRTQCHVAAWLGVNLSKGPTSQIEMRGFGEGCFDERMRGDDN